MMHDVKYFIDKEKGITICKIMNTQDDFISFLAGNDSPLLSEAWNLIYSNSDFTMPREFVGKAQLSAEDVYDEETGKALAYSRAKHLRDKSFFAHANLFANWLDKESNKIFNDIDRYGRRLQKNEEYRLEKLQEHLQ